MPQNLHNKNYIAPSIGLVPSGNRPLVYMESQKRINPCPKTVDSPLGYINAMIMDIHN